MLDGVVSFFEGLFGDAAGWIIGLLILSAALAAIYPIWLLGKIYSVTRGGWHGGIKTRERALAALGVVEVIALAAFAFVNFGVIVAAIAVGAAAVVTLLGAAGISIYPNPFPD